MKILVTGAAGFIGSFLAEKLLQRGDEVIGLDNLNDYYDVNLKYGRLKKGGILKNEIAYNALIQSKNYEKYRFVQLNLEDKENLFALFKKQGFTHICNLAAQAGVRYSLSNPYAYIDSNIIGFMNLLEACRAHKIEHLVYASSSSVYGLNKKMPFSTKDSVDHPISLYAASKKSNELMAHTYSHLFNISTTGLRFFTVYGPWGRPDMALFLFTKAILEGKSIDVFNYGEMFRDFTYIDDIIKGVICVIDNAAKKDENWDSENPSLNSSIAPYRIYNIGNNNPIKLLDFTKCIENELGMEAKKNLLPLQDGDVVGTYADVSDLIRDFNYKPNTPIEVGVRNFVQWYH